MLWVVSLYYEQPSAEVKGHDYADKPYDEGASGFGEHVKRGALIDTPGKVRVLSKKSSSLGDLPRPVRKSGGAGEDSLELGRINSTGGRGRNRGHPFLEPLLGRDHHGPSGTVDHLGHGSLIVDALLGDAFHASGLAGYLPHVLSVLGYKFLSHCRRRVSCAA